MSSGFTNLFRVPEIRKKILITLGLLLAYRIGFHVPIPGVNYHELQRLTEQVSGGFAFGIMNALSGGALGSCMLFTLGVMPYISASIIFSLLVKVVPKSLSSAVGTMNITEAKMIGITPAWLTRSGR